MKLKHLSLAIATMLATQVALAQTKTLDFYSSSGSNRYSISGKVKELNLQVNKNGLLIPEANKCLCKIKQSSSIPCEVY